MKCLLDTHTILWYLFADARLPKTVYEIDEMCRQAGFRKLPVTLDDFNRVRDLPFQENEKHNDPFDRLLISQAIENDLTIVTADSNIPLYDVKTAW